MASVQAMIRSPMVHMVHVETEGELMAELCSEEARDKEKAPDSRRHKDDGQLANLRL